MSTDCMIVQRCALRYNPPTLFIEYKVDSKLRRRSISVTGLMTGLKTNAVVDALLAKHHNLLMNLQRSQLENLVKRLRNNLSVSRGSSCSPPSMLMRQLSQNSDNQQAGIMVSPSMTHIRANKHSIKSTEDAMQTTKDVNSAVGESGVALVDLNEDLNKLNDYDLQKRKDLMDEDFERNRIRQSDAAFVYDKEVDFKVEDNGGGDSWDEDI